MYTLASNSGISVGAAVLSLAVNKAGTKIYAGLADKISAYEYTSGTWGSPTDYSLTSGTFVRSLFLLPG